MLARQIQKAADLLELFEASAAMPGREIMYGQKYEVEGRLVGPSGRISQAMKFKLLDTVVLKRPIPEHRLQAGDLGAVVEIYSPDGFEVEFVTAAGRTQALASIAA